jgi:hypothetical protein
LRKTSGATNEAERSLIAQKIIAAAHKDGAPLGVRTVTAHRARSFGKPSPASNALRAKKFSALRNFFYASQHVDTAANRGHAR